MSYILSRITLKHILTYTLLTAVLFTTLFYISYQARFLLQGPMIALEPIDSVQTRSAVILEGNTANIVSITLNDRPIFTDESGNFKEALILENGYTIATLRAADRFGREMVITQPFVFQGQSNL